MWCRISKLLCALCLIALAPAAAQTADVSAPESAAPEKPLDEPFAEVVEVNIVNVLATVTDKAGRPVRGLSRDDFEVLEDGQPVEISNFYEVSRDQVVESVTAQIESRGPTGLPAPVPDIRPSETRYLVVFVDNTHIEKRNRKLVFQSIRDFVRDNLTSYDQMMVVALQDDYEVVQEFTSSPGDVVAAIDRLERTPALGIRAENSRIQLLRTIESTDLAPATARGPGGAAIPGMTQRAKLESSSRSLMVQIEMLAREEHNMAQKTLAALHYLASSMAGLPGRKAIVYVSDGVPMRPAETLFHAHYNYFRNAAEVFEFEQFLTSPQLAATQFDLTEDFRNFAIHAQANQIMFTAIDAGGKHRTLNISAQRRLRDLDTLAVTEYQPAWNETLDSLHVRNLQSTLEYVAEETGGSVHLNTRDYDGFFRDLRDRLDNYYSLGYLAPHAKEGGRHEIEVRLKGSLAKDLKVQHRRSYYDKTWTDQLTDRTVSEVLLGVGSNPLAVEVTPGPAKRRDDDKLLLPIQIVVPIGNLDLTPVGSERVGNATIVVVVRDENGNTTPPYSMPLAIRLPESEFDGAEGRLAEAIVNLLVSPGKQLVGVGVRDEIGGDMSTTSLDLDVHESVG